MPREVKRYLDDAPKSLPPSDRGGLAPEIQQTLRSTTMARPISGRKVDIKQVIKMRNAGASLQTIAETQGVSKQAIHLMLKDVASMIAPPEQLEQYRAKQADILDTVAMAYSSRLLDEDAIKGASALQAASVLGISIDKSRLISGQSTQNLAVLSYFGGLVEAFGSNEAAEVQGEAVDADTEPS